MEGESTCRPSVLFTSVASTNQVNQVSKFRSNSFFLGHSSLAPLRRMTVYSLSGGGLLVANLE